MRFKERYAPAAGATMEAAVTAVKKLGARSVTAAAPVGSPESCQRLAKAADAVICLRSPEPFSSVGQWYEAFPPVSDAEVAAILTGTIGSSRTAGPASALEIIRREAKRITSGADRFDALVDRLATARLVLPIM